MKKQLILLLALMTANGIIFGNDSGDEATGHQFGLTAAHVKSRSASPAKTLEVGFSVTGHGSGVGFGTGSGRRDSNASSSFDVKIDAEVLEQAKSKFIENNSRIESTVENHWLNPLKVGASVGAVAIVLCSLPFIRDLKFRKFSDFKDSAKQALRDFRPFFAMGTAAGVAGATIMYSAERNTPTEVQYIEKSRERLSALDVAKGHEAASYEKKTAKELCAMYATLNHLKAKGCKGLFDKESLIGNAESRRDAYVNKVCLIDVSLPALVDEMTRSTRK